jgi:hypothetical protein
LVTLGRAMDRQSQIASQTAGFESHFRTQGQENCMKEEG